MRKPLYFFLFLIFSISLFSQDTIQIITFDGNVTNEVISKSNTKENNPSNIVRLGMLTSLNGYTPIYYERKLTNTIALEVMLGITYRSIANDFDYLTSPRSFNRLTNPLYTYDIDDNYEVYDGIRRSSIGYCAGITPKIYPSSNALDGFYIGPQVNYKYSRFNVRKAQYNPNYYGYTYGNIVREPNYTFKERIHQIDFSFNLGKNFILQNHITLNVNANVGAKYMIGNREDIGYYGSDIVTSYRNYKKAFPYLNIDFSIGGWF